LVQAGFCGKRRLGEMSREGLYGARRLYSAGEENVMTPDQEIPDREQRVVDLLTQARVSTRAPEGLRARVGAVRESPAKQRRASRARGIASLRVGLAAAAAVVAGALVITLGGGSTTEAPSLVQVAALSGRGPAGPAPGPLASASTTLLTAAVGSLHFPNWRDDGGYRSSGERTDTVAGRTVKTVFYTHGGTRLAYSIVASPVLRGSRVADSPYGVVQVGSRVTVVWTDRGHTCELTGVGTDAEALWSLAKTTLE